MSMRPYLLETCPGVKPSGCRNALPLPPDFETGLAELVAAAPQPPGLAGLGRPPRAHERFRLAVCACPNGCTRPQVADLGFLAAVRPEVSARGCAGCGACLDACPDGALALEGGIAVIDRTRCLGCGKCGQACPAGAIACGETQLRGVVGGRLGRRPRLGLELAERLSPHAALALASRCLDAYVGTIRPGLRFGDLVVTDGLPGLPAWVLS